MLLLLLHDCRGRRCCDRLHLLRLRMRWGLHSRRTGGRMHLLRFRLRLRFGLVVRGARRELGLRLRQTKLFAELVDLRAQTAIVLVELA